MGDSITYGQYVDPQARWTALVEKWLEEMLLEMPFRIENINRGISGETTRMGLERFPGAVQNSSPDILTLQYGLNDCNCWETDRGMPRVSRGAYRENLTEMIARARRFGASEIVLANNHRTLREKLMPNGEQYEDANYAYGEISREVAVKTNVAFCDVHKAFSGRSMDELETLLLPYPDQLHLSAEGNRLYAETIWPFVKRAVENVMRNKAQTHG
jgi:lysophospholipase L1-like esterase